MTATMAAAALCGWQSTSSYFYEKGNCHYRNGERLKEGDRLSRLVEENLDNAFNGERLKEGDRLSRLVEENLDNAFRTKVHNRDVWENNRTKTSGSFYFEIVDPKAPPLYGLLYDAANNGPADRAYFFVDGQLERYRHGHLETSPRFIESEPEITVAEKKSLLLRIDLSTLLSIGYSIDDTTCCERLFRTVVGCGDEETGKNLEMFHCGVENDSLFTAITTQSQQQQQQRVVSIHLSSRNAPNGFSGPPRRLVPESAVTAAECAEWTAEKESRKPDDYRRLEKYKFRADTRGYYIEDVRKFAELCEFGGLGVAQSLEATRNKKVTKMLDLFYEARIDKSIPPSLHPSLVECIDGTNRSETETDENVSLFLKGETSGPKNRKIELQNKYNDKKSYYPLTTEEVIKEFEKSDRGFAWKQIPFSIYAITQLVLMEVSFFEVPLDGVPVLFFLIGPVVIVWLVQGVLLISIWQELPQYQDVGHFTCSQLPSLQLSVVAVFLLTLMSTLLEVFHEFCAIVWSKRALRTQYLFQKLSPKNNRTKKLDDELEIAILPNHWDTRMVALFIWAMETSILVFTGVVGALYILTQEGASNTVQAAVVLAFINEIDNLYAEFLYPEIYGRQKVEIPINAFSVSEKGNVSTRFLFLFIPSVVLTTMAIVYGFRLNYLCHPL